MDGATQQYERDTFEKDEMFDEYDVSLETKQ